MRYATLALLLVGHAGSVHASVHPDCFEDGITCEKARIDDIHLADEVFGLVASRSGWPQGCFEIQYLRGDSAGPGSILVSMKGPGHVADPACRDVVRLHERGAPKAAMKKLANEFRHAVAGLPAARRARVLRGVDSLDIVNGWGGQVHITLP